MIVRLEIGFALLLFATSASAQGKSVAESEPMPLVESSSQILEAPPFTAMGSPLCDERGGVFFHVPLVSNSFTDSSVIRLSAGSSDPVLFQLPKELASKNVFTYFSVTPSGKVFFLDTNVEDPTREGPQYVFAFDSNGDMNGQEKLDVPDHVTADDFAVSATGAIFFSGHFSSDAPDSIRGRHYQAIFEKTGKLRVEIHSVDSKAVDLSAIGSDNGGTVAVGIDGNYYLLRPDRLVVISENGEVLRNIRVPRPAKDESATTLRLSGGLAAIEFQKADDKGRIDSEFLVLDLDTGDAVGLYSQPAGFGYFLCFSRTVGFTFKAREGNKVKLITAGMR
jgi:hypothetical protein